MNSKLTAEGIMGAAMRMGAELSGGEFPISVFPHKIQRIITELHASQGYPIDYISAAMLSALAVSIGNSHLAQVKRGWVEGPILYMALIGRPGANKSHPLSFAFHPFIEHDYRHNKEYQEQYAEYERTMSMTKKERLEAGKDEFPIPPKRSRFLVSDITPEGLSLIHAQNPRGCAYGQTSYRRGLRTSTATTKARRSSSGCRCSTPNRQSRIVRARKVQSSSSDPISRL